MNSTPPTADAPRRPTLTLKRPPLKALDTPPKPPGPLIHDPADCFWINWRLDSRRPKVRHHSLEKALAEAARIRSLRPGVIVHTFECRLVSIKQEPSAAV